MKLLKKMMALLLVTRTWAARESPEPSKYNVRLKKVELKSAAGVAAGVVVEGSVGRNDDSQVRDGRGDPTSDADVVVASTEIKFQFRSFVGPNFLFSDHLCRAFSKL